MEYMPPRRRHRLGETRYVSELLQRFYPKAIHIAPIRLGTLPEPIGDEEWTPEERALLTVRMRWADAVAIEDHVIHLIEAKLLPARYFAGLAQLEIYRELIPHTEALKPYLPAEIRCELWTPIEDPWVKAKAAERGMYNPIWQPDWFREFLHSWYPRWRRPSRYE